MDSSRIPGILVYLILLSSLVATMRVSAQQLPLRIFTHNIRYATDAPFTGEKPWADRRQLLLNELHYNTLYNQESFICMQEVLHNQLVDIQGGLGEEWAYIGVGRDDGKEAGEYSPIFYRKAIWMVERWRTVWLSQTPDVPGKGWDAASVRIVTVGHFVHVQSKKRVLGMCTHLDDQGAVSRRESAKLILKVIANETAMAQGPGVRDALPVFLAGDLNSPMEDDAYEILNAGNSTLRDAKELAGWRYGENYTFTGFQDSEPKQLIDDVFVGPRGGQQWAVKGYAVLPNRFEDGVYDSDHRAVVADTVVM